MRRLFSLSFALVACLLPVQAHEFTWTDARLRIDGAAFTLTLVCDLDPLALGNPPGSDNAAQAAVLRALSPEDFAARRAHLIDFFQRRVRVRFDGQSADLTVTFPEENLANTDEVGIFGTTVALAGTVPEQAEGVSVAGGRALPALRLTLMGADGPIGDPLPIPSGQRGETVPLHTLVDFGVAATAKRYLGLGFFHIIPLGPDHILFVLGLFLLCRRQVKPLLLQVTAFTAAHTLTLALAAAGVVSLPSKPVEVLIAASIVYLAVENWFSETLKPHRLAVVFCFGLLHGLGFAGVLGELGLPQQAFVSALVSFNVGVELGQLAVIAAAFAVLGWFQASPHYHTRVVRPLSLAIGLIAAYWVVERLFF